MKYQSLPVFLTSAFYSSNCCLVGLCVNRVISLPFWSNYIILLNLYFRIVIIFCVTNSDAQFYLLTWWHCFMCICVKMLNWLKKGSPLEIRTHNPLSDCFIYTKKLIHVFTGNLEDFQYVNICFNIYVYLYIFLFFTGCKQSLQNLMKWEILEIWF